MRLRLLISIRRWCLLWAVGSALLLLPWQAVNAQQPVAPAAEALGPFKSTFVNDVAYGKDPFFPRSSRRESKAPPTPELPPVQVFAEGLELRGLSGSNPGRLAIINNRTFAVGEEHIVKIREQRVTVKCLEIRDDSVVVNVGGLTRELHFRKKP